MNYIKITLQAALLLGSASLASAAAPGSIDVSSISEFVYPGNQPASPERMVFMPDGLSYLMLSQDGRTITSYDTRTGKQLATVFDASHTRENSMPSVESFSVSPDGSRLLLYTGKSPVYRRSFTASYYVFEIKRNILRPLSKQFSSQQSPVFSPDSRMVAFVVDNNIYVKKLDYDSEVQVTEDGEKNRVINGVPDWTYEEEFSTDCSMAWSPDASILSFIRYDESQVPLFTFSLYEGWCKPNAEYALYPGVFSYKYPVAGERNSAVSVLSYDVDTRKTKTLALSDPSIEYIPRIGYGGKGAETLMVVTLNRDQNRMEVYNANPKTGIAKSVLVEESKIWLSDKSYENIVFNTDNFVVFSERSGWCHLYKYSYEGQQLAQITSGDYEATAYYGEDAAGFSYYQSQPAGSTASNPSAALNRVVYRVDKFGKKTETLSPESGWSSADFAPSMGFYTLSYSNASEAPLYTLHNAKGQQLREICDNRSYQARYQGVPAREFFTVESDGRSLNGYMVKPAGFDASRRYPVIMWLYNGPGSQEVLNRWQLDWQNFAAREGFVVVCVDGRGTGGRGVDFRAPVYRRLGYYETVDQLNVARYLSQLGYVDASRIGICGWSYGGYETLMAVTDPASTFKAAVAIAPVTSWRYYDTVYAERFMLTPQQNAEGYDASAPVNRAANMNCRLLLMAGTSDDNVHLSNTIEFVGQLQNNHRYADMFLFPGMNHSINGCDARAMVYGRMIDYFKANL